MFTDDESVGLDEGEAIIHITVDRESGHLQITPYYREKMPETPEGWNPKHVEVSALMAGLGQLFDDSEESNAIITSLIARAYGRDTVSLLVEDMLKLIHTDKDDLPKA